MLLNDGRLNIVIKSLLKRCEAGKNEFPDLAEVERKVKQYAVTYKYMQDFLMKGKEDNGRAALYSDIKSGLKQQLHNYLFITNTETSSDEFFSNYRLDKISTSQTLAELIAEYDRLLFRIEKARETESSTSHLVRRKEDILEKIFNRIWTSSPWRDETMETLSMALPDENHTFELRAQIVSAIFLSLLKFYNEEKICLLIDTYINESDEVMAARLLLVIVFAIDIWKVQIKDSKEILIRLETMSDSLMTYTRLRDVAMTIVKTRDTDRVSNEIRSTFDIAMKKITPDLMNRLREEGMSVDMGEFGGNPEWKKIMKEDNLEERMQAISEMQMEGMDVMIETFGRLKTFPFFRYVSNWFLPFSTDRSEISAIFEAGKGKHLAMLADIIGMCASDRYSFALGFNQMPPDKRDMFLLQVGGASEIMEEQFKNEIKRRQDSTFSKALVSYARDIYRFFKLYPRNSHFLNVFGYPIDFIGLPVIGSLLDEPEIVNMIANFYFDYGYHDLALELLENVAQRGEVDMHIFEKIGYCYQMRGNFVNALANYEKADLFSSDVTPASNWLLRKLAFCNKALHLFPEAIKYYKILLERDPDDMGLETQLGDALLQSGNIQEGMEHLAKVHYIDPNNKHCTRSYIKGLLLRRDIKEAEKESRKLDPDSWDFTDKRLLGHLMFLSGNVEKASEFYLSSRNNMNLKEFRNQLLEEIIFLSSQQIDNVAFAILLDLTFENFDPDTSL